MFHWNGHRSGTTNDTTGFEYILSNKSHDTFYSAICITYHNIETEKNEKTQLRISLGNLTLYEEYRSTEFAGVHVTDTFPVHWVVYLFGNLAGSAMCGSIEGRLFELDSGRWSLIEGNST